MKRSGQLTRTAMPARRTRLQPGENGLKPGGPLRRETPLGRRAELRSKPKPAAVNPLVRSTPPAPTGMTRKRPRDTGPSKDVKDMLRKERAKGRCERCAGTGRLDVHHRRGRKAGGTKRLEINSPENLLVLCRPCHNAITNTNGNRVAIEFEGLLIREDLRDPADVKVLLADGWFFLTASGGKTPTTAPERAA